MTVNYNGAGGGIVHHAGQDFVSFEQLARQQKPAWSAAEKRLAKKFLDVSEINGEEVVAGWNLTAKLPRAIDAIVRYRMQQNRPQQGPRELTGNYKDVHFVAAHTGLSEQGAIDAAKQCGAIAVDPQTGEQKINWHLFDRAWRQGEFRAAVKRADKNRVAEQSAAKIQAAAEKKSDDQILAQARAAEDARCAAALEHARAQQRAASAANRRHQ